MLSFKSDFSFSSFTFIKSLFSSLGLINLLDQFIEPRKPLYWLTYWFITREIKGCELTTKWIDTLGKVFNKGAFVLVGLGPVMTGACGNSSSAAWKLFETPFGEVLWRPHYIGITNSLVVGDLFNLQHFFPSPKSEKIDNSSPLITWLVLLTSAPIFRLFYPKVTWLA